jgi:hypothetical protein
MNPRSTWLLVLTALGLGAYLFFSERTPAVRVDGLAGPRVPFAMISASQVTSVEILRSNAVVRLERDGDTWRLRQPVADLADRGAVDSFLRNLARLRPKNSIPSSQIDAGSGGLSAFGLDASAVTLKVETGSQPALFKLGARAPIGGDFYFQRVGDESVFTADAALLDSLPESPSGWRDRSLFTVPAAAVDRVELRGRTQFEARRMVGPKGAVTWRMVRPVEARADGDRLEALMGLLQRVKIHEFVSDAPGADLERYGLQPPESELFLHGATNTLVHLQIGRSPTNNPGLVYVRRMSSTNVVLVPATTVLPLQGTLASFRDRHLLPAMYFLNRLEFAAAGRTNALEREGTNWWIAGAQRLPARVDLVAFFLARLGALEIAEFPNDVVADYSRYGLAAPVRTYGFQEEKGTGTNGPLRLLLGETGDRESALVFARRSDEAPVYSLRRADVARLPESALQFRDFRFASSNVVKVVAVHHGRTRTLERSTTGEWVVTAGLAGAPFSPAAEETLHRLGLLETIPFVVPNESLFTSRPSFSELGLELTLILDSSAPIRKWRLRFVTDLGALAIALSNFDDDPVPYSLEIPGALFREIQRDFSVLPRE